jgi:hypothetical protein
VAQTRVAEARQTDCIEAVSVQVSDHKSSLIRISHPTTLETSAQEVDYIPTVLWR